MTMNGPLSEAIGLAVLHLLWQGVVVAGVLAIALRLLSRASANVRYALSCAALAALVAFGVVTAQRSYEPAGVAVDVVAPSDVVIAAISEPAAAEPGMLERAAAFIDIHSSTIAFLW